MTSLLGCALDDGELPVGEVESAELTATGSTPTVTRTVKSIVDEEVGPMTTSTGQRRYVGLSVVVIKHGTRYQYHYGEAVLGSGVLPTSKTFYAIGSVTKTFTATLLALLERRNLVDFDDLLSSHTGYALGGDRDQITLEDLALHHAGLPRNPPGGESAYHTGTYSGDFSALMGTLDDCTTTTPCDAPPSLTADGAYSNYGFAVLGYVLSRRQSSLASIQLVFNSTFLDTLGMTDTRNKSWITEDSCVAASDPCTYDDYGECTYVAACNSTFSPRAAIGYSRSSSTAPFVRSSDEGSDDNIKAGSGTLWSTPTDMSKWLAYHMGVSTTATDELTAILPAIHRVRTGDDLAFFGKRTVTPEGHSILRKTGDLPGQFDTYMAFVEGGDVGVVVMSNGDGGVSPGDLGPRIIDALVD